MVTSEIRAGGIVRIMRHLFRKLMVIILLAGFFLEESSSSTIQPVQTSSPSAQAQVQVSTALLSATTVASTINITQQDYVNALARWQAQGVSEYEITLIDSSRMDIGGKMKLRIALDRGNPRLVEYTMLSQTRPQLVPLSTLSADELDHLRGLSVEAMFGVIGELFNGNPPGLTRPNFDYDIAFDPELGYPTHVYSRLFNPQNGVFISECCISYEVLDLNVLQRSVPGMPRTGNPEP